MRNPFNIGFLIICMTLFVFIGTEAAIMAIRPTSPDNVKIREETVKIIYLLAGGVLAILGYNLKKDEK